MANEGPTADAFAILLAAHHPHLELIGVSTVHGNASLAQTTANAGSILTALGVHHIPYYAGAAKPFCREAVHAPNIHGDTGLDGTELLPKAHVGPVEGGNAVAAMREELLAQPAPWLVATGALTNVALLFAAFPEVGDHIRGLSIMGGAIGNGFTNAPMGHVRGEGERLGNHTPWAEFNIYCDPEAAQSIFSNPLVARKTTLIPLDLTHQVLATRAVQERLLHGPSVSVGKGASDVRQLFNELLLFFAHTYADVFGISNGPPLHDPLAVAVILSEGYEDLKFDDCKGERWDVNVVTDGIHSDDDHERGQVGRTVISPSKERGIGVRIPRGLNVELFWDTVEDCLRRVDERLSSRDNHKLSNDVSL
ncbi:MAG: hypothetical protein LQ339_005880 [Xanthoria mediterranea]|nr:MAG: hypothetical protein LQ339_005880 [Xanthoria mediterranea]